jgi:hypothetical protein
MARIRTIKPEIWLSPQVMNLSLPARLLFIGLITQADDQGRGIADPRRLKAAVLPADDVTASQVEEWLREIAAQRLAVLYESTAHGRLYSLPSWFQHQSINKPKSSAYPPVPGVVPDADGSDTEGIPDEYRTSPGGSEGKGTEGKGARAQARATPARSPDPAKPPEVQGLDVEAWARWLSYRRDIGKPIKAASAEAAARKLAAFGGLQASVVEQSVAAGWQGLFALKGDGPQPATLPNGKPNPGAFKWQ